MTTTDKTSCRILSSLLQAHGVEEVVISPGSRNTPIILALDANKHIRKRVVIDERVAAFVALGIAQTSSRPVAIVCTSGTALLNYAPAVAEAYYQGLPLIVISADRPMQWIDQDDSQTIRQHDALSNIVKKSYDIPEFRADDSEMTWYANRVINDALLEACDRRRGPVHINIQLNQPLSDTIEVNESDERKISSLKTLATIDSSLLEPIISEIRGQKTLIIGGFHGLSNEINQSLRQLSMHDNIVVLTETISNVKGGNIYTNIDRIIAPLSEEELETLRPDIVISFGGALVSRYVKQFLRKCRPLRHFSIGYNHTTVDCFKSLTDRVDIAPETFFSLLVGTVRSNTDTQDKDRTVEKTKMATDEVISYASLWKKHNADSLESHERFIAECPWSDLKAFSVVAETLQRSERRHVISLSNGTPIRYFQLFDGMNYSACYCNRGVSGIDGSTSTAIGTTIGIADIITDATSVLITGDMSFSYDIGALATKFIPDNFKIIVLNNSGGGIFRFIPSTARLPQLEQYFAVNPGIKIDKLAEAYDFAHFVADSQEQLEDVIDRFLSHEHKAILEIVTPPDVSGEILRQYMNRK